MWLRPAEERDMKQVWEWVNDPVTRANALDSHFITWEEHRNWFRETINGWERELRIIDIEGESCGSIRLDFDADPTTALIAINIAPDSRGQGLGTQALKEIVFIVQEFTSIGMLVAYIRPENAASKRIFEKAGYIYLTSREENGTIVDVYTLSV
jgi:RimJ/RimL family protein N-acetyltransferase